MRLINECVSRELKMKKVEVNAYLRDCMADALISLLEKKPIAKITVEEIVLKAGVGRATYFRAFDSKEEIITYKFIRMWEHYCDQHQIRVRDRFDLNNAKDFFEYNYSIRSLLLAVYHAGLEETVHQAFCRILLTMECRMDPLRLYREKFFAYGLFGLLDEWIRNDFLESPDEMVSTLRQILELNIQKTE